ncbi:MAG: 5-(carboxyamino)imidazole ribonucleotide synthase [Bosea sp. (in: a-proteobacteria)]|uniref:5-(carboxyamino)imidazole ribonucleotide synthase n=1 Tax=Bosea sp. (in: a-proteobacteria) TaxID=1871050 RepID=UPI0027367B84|nr:5-(carboxyamino)imidazole ribonucleotide synthase [Bosea sp. (in: a-proteobacteria)]MDP3603904.1 5-(carboxyamino)imidazole ribonucleotide synthase [Bosea sp. (in: a-proteobacteria)]
MSAPVVEGVPFEGLAPGAVLGILGGGQLARMIALAAADLGIASHIFAPEPENPAFDVAAAKTVAPYEDEAALARFADAVDVVTYEFENVPAATAAFLAARKPLHPGAHALAVTQDRLSEKRFVSEQGLTVAPFRAVDSLSDLEDAVAALGRPCVLKTRRFGYDGKGQVKILPGTDLAEAYEAIGRQPAVLEGFVSFAREVSVVAARGTDGSFAAFDLCENEHRDHILAFTRIPAQVSAATEAAAIEAARRIGAALGYVGVFAVEMFIVGEGPSESVVVNEIAPRVHNSGHWTSEGAQTSQFHQHVRAVCGFPLGSAARRGRVEMENLIGDAALRWRELLAEPGAHLHLYGKREARPGRKMGHVTRVVPEQG